MKNSYAITLSECREKIDQEDKIIIESLERRVKIVEDVSHIKHQTILSPIELYFNIKRECSMMRNFFNTTKLSQEMIYGIWRNIISSANKMEQKIDILYDNDDAKIEICKEYPVFCDTKKTENIIHKIVNPKNAVMGVFSLNDGWWYDIFIENKSVKNNLKIFKIINNFAFIGYISDISLVDEYYIYIIESKDLKDDMIILSEYKDKILVSTKNKTYNEKLIGLVPSVL